MMSQRFFAPIVAVAVCILHLTCKETPVQPNSFVPVVQDDNWPVSTPQAQGMNEDMLVAGYDAAEDLPYIYSLLVVRHGFLVAEQYFNGNSINIPNNVQSVSKSFLSALTGIALREGYLDSLNHRMLDYFPEYVTPSIDSAKYDITLRHLLTMRAGFGPDESVYVQITNSSNWVQTTLNLPLSYAPGSRTIYSTCEAHLLSVILTKASGTSTRSLVDEFLCEPLGITLAFWPQDPQGYHVGGNNMGFTPRDLAKFGHLYHHEGLFNGIQIVPKAWVDSSFANSTGHQGTSWGDLVKYGYGYFWWLGELSGHPVRFALGYGGQYILLVPDLDMIVVSTADWYYNRTTADEHERAILHIMATYILPAAN